MSRGVLAVRARRPKTINGVSALPGQLAVVGAVLLLWQILSMTGAGGNTLPGVGQVAGELLGLLGDPSTWGAIGDTFSGELASLAMAIVIAVPLGIGIGRSDFWYRSTRLLVDFKRSVPGLALLPLASLLFGTRLPTELLIVVPTCVFPILLQMVYGARDIDPLLMDMARMYRLGRITRFVRITLASCASYLATGLRLAIIMGFIATVGTELVAGTPGIGFSLANAQAVGATLQVYAYTVLISLMGFALTMVLTTVERLLIPWRVSGRRQA
ncbi:ABC transporter permease [Amycolatopsis jejuensis]|uniref:ABC transporter permease n=1 Tax=Amycolatopsis jejuensis TaxID=330084 RepID=UPI00068D4D4F|nr:ABC transporter permease subunit [Amycolatopsis jejuensis]